MRRFLTTIAALLIPLLPAATRNIVEILEKMPPSRVVFSVKILDRTGAETGSSSGSAELQYPCFKVSYGALMICGDSKAVWLRDLSSDEVTIYGGNALNSIFSDKSLKFDQANRIVTINTADGGHTDFSIELVENMANGWPESHFRMDPSTFGPDTIVTDLR